MGKESAGKKRIPSPGGFVIAHIVCPDMDYGMICTEHPALGRTFTYGTMNI